MATKKPNYIWTTPSIIHLVVGADHTPTNELEGTGTLASASNKVYRAGTEYDALLTGSAAITGRAITGETFTPDKAGTYIYNWIVADEGENRYMKTKYIVAKASSE